MLGLFASFFLSSDPKYSIILDKLPNLIGLHRAPSSPASSAYPTANAKPRWRWACAKP